MSKIVVKDLLDMPETPIKEYVIDSPAPKNASVTPTESDDFDFELIDLDKELEEKPDKREKKRGHKDKKNRVSSIIMAIIILLLLSAVAGLLVYIFSTPKTAPVSPQTPASSNVVVDTTAKESSGDIFADEPADETPMFTATGYYDMTISKGDKVNLTNSLSNHADQYDVYMQYLIYEVADDEEKEIIETGIIEPGMMVEWDVSNDLAPGSHKIRIVEQPYLWNPETREYDPKFNCDQFITITVN